MTKKEFLEKMDSLLAISEDFKSYSLYYLLKFDWSYKVAYYYNEFFPDNLKIVIEMYPEFMFENDETYKIIEEDYMCLKELGWQMFLDCSLENELYLEY